MKKTMAIVLVCLTATVLAQSPPPASKTDGASEKQQKAIVHLSHFTDDLHRVTMALKVATMMQKGGAQVSLFLDLEGVRLAERRQRLDLSWGADSQNIGELYDGFVEAGGRTVLCPHCAKSARIGEMALKRWASIGTEEGLAEMFLSADKVIDY